MSETPPQAYISKVHLKGYKSIKDLEIDFKPGLNIIIGPNGSGKTNFLNILVQCISNRFTGFKAFNVLVEATGLRGKYWQNAQISEKDELTIIYKALPTNDNFSRKLKVITKTKKNNITIKEDNYEVSQGRIMMQGALTSLDTIPNLYLPFGLPNKIFAITSPSQFSEIVENDNKIIDIDYNFNDFDYIIKYFLNTGDFSTDDESKVFIFSNELKNALKQYTPIKDIKVDDSKFLISIKENKTIYQNIYINFLVENQWLEWDDLSDGTKRIFYIVSLIIIECEIGDIVPIFIEEPELGIHPDQLSDLMDFLQAQAKEKQIIITTHSPEVMNILNKDELDRIIVTRFDKDKGTQMHKLSPHKIKKGQIYMKKVGHLSDFWVHSNLEEIDEED